MGKYDKDYERMGELLELYFMADRFGNKIVTADELRAQGYDETLVALYLKFQDEEIQESQQKGYEK